MTLQTIKLGIVGGGMMAENILRGVLSAGLLKAPQVMVADIHPGRLTHLQKTFGVKTVSDGSETVAWAQVIILAVKPQNMAALLESIAPCANREKLFLSIAAGISCAALSRGLSDQGRIVRVMPNTPAKVLAAASALCRGPAATDDDVTLAQQLFDSLGSTVVVEEGLMDAVTGLSGSGPAYIFLVIEALADAGVRAGLPRATAVTLAAQTCYGAAKLVLETGAHPGVLKDQVTSPGGTTIAGMHTLESHAVRGAFMDAVAAAVARSRELGRLSE